MPLCELFELRGANQSMEIKEIVKKRIRPSRVACDGGGSYFSEPRYRAGETICAC
jgi:hypothetical protein